MRGVCNEIDSSASASGTQLLDGARQTGCNEDEGYGIEPEGERTRHLQAAMQMGAPAISEGMS
jgi:hypothetical protein